jgi:hypothetical protein
MKEQEIYEKLAKQAPNGYRLNELILFSYPVRRLKLNLLVNKNPDDSLVKVYVVILRSIQAGFNTQGELFGFLGLGETDEFMIRELFSLREKEYVNFSSGKWTVSEFGQEFLKDHSILRIEEKEDFEFLVDDISGELISLKESPTEKLPLDKKLDFKLNYVPKSPNLLEDKFHELSDIYKADKDQKSYLMSYSPDEIKSDKGEWCNYWLSEYMPLGNLNQEAYLEVRSFQNLKKIKSLSSKFNAEYRQLIYKLSNVERADFEELATLIKVPKQKEEKLAEFSHLTIWETKQKFIEALSNVNKRILIESPWIKRATQEYIPFFKEILQSGKQLIILYGISEKDDHDYNTMKQIEELHSEYKSLFHLIHLPTHFEKSKSKLSGTHRKLVIKDDDFFIAGSFNFLSFGKNESQQVANEESMLIASNVQNKWEQVIKEYSLKF